MKKRYRDMDILRGIGIFLVVFGHSFPDNTLNNNAFYCLLFNMIYSFHMPLYFFLAGFFAQKVYDIEKFSQYSEFVGKKFKRLLVPYFLISFIAIPIKLFMNCYAVRTVGAYEMVLNLLIYPLDIPIQYFWFIYILFIIFITAPLLNKIKLQYVLILTFILNLTVPIQSIKIFYISGVLHYIFYFYLGLGFRKVYKQCNIQKKYNLLIFMICLILLVNITKHHTDLEFMKLVYLDLASLVGIIMTISLSQIFKNIKLGNAFEVMGRYSYDIYLFSWFFQTSARVIFYQYLKLDYNISMIFMMIFGFLPILLSKFILRKHSLSNKLFLGNW